MASFRGRDGAACIAFALSILLPLAGCDSPSASRETVPAPPPVMLAQHGANPSSAAAAAAAWHAAERIHTETAYKTFANEHPQDPRAAKAQASAGRLAWLHAQKLATAQAYQAFRDGYPHDPHADEARKMVEGQEVSLAQAVRRGWVRSHVTGSGLQSVSLTVKRTVHRPLRIAVPAGTFFVSGGDSQNMVACEDTTADLTSSSSADLSVSAACANFYRAQPDETNTFSVRDAHPDPKLRKVLATIAKTNPSSTVSQLAIWAITDNPSRREIEEHITPSPRVDAFRQAAGLLRAAGVSPSSRRMFRNLP